MVEFKNQNQLLQESGNNDESELHIKYLAERRMGCLKQEITRLDLDRGDLEKRKNEQKKAILRAGQKLEQLQQELVEGRKVLDALRQDADQAEEDHAFLMKCMQEDECRTVNDLLLRIKKQSIEAKQRHDVMDENWGKTATTELEWERMEEAICHLCREMEELTKHWKTSVSHMTKRDQEMDQSIRSLSVVKEELEAKREMVKKAKETLKSLRRRNVLASSRLEAVCRKAAKMKAAHREQESQSATLYGECEILRCAVERADTEVKTAQSLLAELTTDVHSNKDRLENTKLHSFALEEKLKTEMELGVRAKQEAEWAEQEVKKEEQARKEADACLYGHEGVLSRKAEELRALKWEEKERHAAVLAGRGALSTMNRKQREADRILSGKKEAVNKQDSKLECLEKRLQELSAREERNQVELLKVEVAQIAMDIEERKRTLRHAEQKNQEGELAKRESHAKREVEKLVSERQDLSCKVEDLELIAAASDKELSEITRQRLELMKNKNLMELQVKQARNRLQSQKDHIVALESQRLLLVEEYKQKVAELNLQKEVVQRQIKQVTQRCQKTRVERNRQRLKIQKLQKKHEAISVTTVYMEGEEVSMQQYTDEMKRQRQELKQKDEDLNRKLAAKQRKVTALKKKLSAVRGENEALCIAPKNGCGAFSVEECEQSKALDQTLCAMQDDHAKKTSQIKELKLDIKGMNLSLDELLHEEREGLRKGSLLQDLHSEILAQEGEMSWQLKLCSELNMNIQSDMATDDKTEERDVDWHELQEFSEMVEMLLVEVMDQYPDLRSVLQALFIESGLTLERSSVWSSQQCRESVSSHSCDSSGRGSIKTMELQSQDPKPAIQVQGNLSQLINHQHDSGRGSTDTCWGRGSTPTSRDSSTPSDGRSSRSSDKSRES